MRPRIRTYTASDGYRLHYRHWEPEAGPKARIVALHGIQSHSGWFTYSSRRLCEAGFEVLFLDRRGSGMNEPARGDAASDAQLVDDVTQMLVRVGERSGASDSRRPVILLGMSWGGKLAAVTAARSPDLVDQLVLLYPGLCAHVHTRWDQNLWLAMASRLGMRGRRIRVPLDDAALFTGDRVWQDFIRTDPLALRDVSVSFLLANRRLDRALPQLPAVIRCPLLAMLAGRDEITDNEATKRYLSKFTASRSTVIEYPAARHTLEFEPDREKFVNDLVGWLQGQL
jgi:alpha-beta hydrolase superfamily lysophospholipase